MDTNTKLLFSVFFFHFLLKFICDNYLELLNGDFILLSYHDVYQNNVGWNWNYNTFCPCWIQWDCILCTFYESICKAVKDAREEEMHKKIEEDVTLKLTAQFNSQWL